MSDSGVINEEPPDENEAYENLDEANDDADALGDGPEGGRDLDGQLVVDETELEEAGANLDDPEADVLLDGGMDDPDIDDPDADAEDSWNEEDEAEDDAEYERQGGTSGEVVDTATPLAEDDRIGVGDLANIPEDAPGPDSARW